MVESCVLGQAPRLLDEFQSVNPNATWDDFRNECQDGYKEVQNQLREEQGNLCCYCEIDTKQGHGTGIDDFRVEHFHPKSDHADPHYNWALDWQNILGCCHGGSERSVIDKENRYILNNSERHSDVLKGGSNWDSEILNPLEIPAFPILFQANRSDGSLSVHENNCLASGIDIEIAKNCLAPEKLNLNSTQLKSLRKATLDALNNQIKDQLLENIEIDDAIKNLVIAELQRDDNQHWPRFFTTIRSYLGIAAEEYLKSINYIG